MLPEKTPAKTKAKPEARPETAKVAPEPGVSYMLQAASFATFSEADQLKARLALSGLAAQIQKVSIEGRGDYYRVRLGPFSKIEELDSASQQLQQIGLKPIRLKVKRKAPDAALGKRRSDASAFEVGITLDTGGKFREIVFPLRGR